LPLEARELDPERHIFSVNIIEHFQPLDDNLDGLARVMKSNGVQVHTCPKYHVPYEPPIWRSLNFITVRTCGSMQHGMASR
jgi:hypothetical protein